MDTSDQKAWHTGLLLVALSIGLYRQYGDVSAWTMTGGLWLLAASIKQKRIRMALAIAAAILTAFCLIHTICSRG